MDYLTKPLEVFKEMHRCLKPGGLAIMSFSNRCFPTKAIAMWTQTGARARCFSLGSAALQAPASSGAAAAGTLAGLAEPSAIPLLLPSLPPPPAGDADHIWIVGSYFHYSVPGGFAPPAAKDISPRRLLGGGGDPMYVVYARKA